MGLRVVIADDESITRMDLKERLTLHGYEVVGEAVDGFDAIELCRQHKPDLILLDIKMPVLDGLGAAKIINEEDLSGCIVMLTAYSDKNFVDIANDRGVMGYLIKPIDDRSLIPTIEIAIGRSRGMAELKKDIREKERKIEERKLVDKAKGILMSENKMSEEEAYKYMRMISMSKRISIGKVAEMMLLSHRHIGE